MNKHIQYSILAATALMAFGAHAAPHGGIITSAQQRLNTLGYYSGPVDGVLGNKTRLAVMSFQHANGLAETGTINPETYSLLGDHYGDRFDTTYYDGRGYRGYDYRYGRAAYGYVPGYYSASASANTVNWRYATNAYANARALPIRFGRMEVIGNGGAGEYAVILNGQTVLQASNQPQPLSVSRVHQLSGEDAVIVTAHDGTGSCSSKHYLITVKNDGTYLPARQIGDCNSQYQAKVDGNMLYVTFPDGYGARRYADTWRYSNDALVRL